MKGKFNPDNCKNIVRAQVHFCGIAVTLIGKHAHEWSICIEENTKIRIDTFQDRLSAQKEFRRYKEMAKPTKKNKR